MAGRRRSREAPSSPPSPERADYRTTNAFERRAACELAFTDATGPTLVFGTPPPYVLAGLAASAAGATFCGGAKATRAARRAYALAAPGYAASADDDGGGSPIVEGVHGALVVCGLDPREPEEVLERLLGALADGGAATIDVPRPDPSTERRVTRLVAAAADGGGVERPSWAPADRLVLRARRRAPFGPEVSDEPAGALPVSVIVVVRDAAAAEPALVDVLLRQTLPLSDVLVLDLAPSGGASVPEDLFGIKPGPWTRVALVPKPGASFAAAVDDALGAVATPFVAVLDGDVARAAANHFAALGMALERDPDAAAAFGDVAEIGVDGRFAAVRATDAGRLRRPLRTILEAGGFRTASGLWRTEFVRDLGGFDDAFGLGADLDFRLRAAARSRFVGVPIPTIALRPESGISAAGAREARARAVAACAERVAVAAFAREGDEAPPEARETAAMTRFGAALLDAGLPEAAATRFEAALRRSPGDAAARDGLVRAGIRSGRLAAAERVAEAASDPAARDVLLGRVATARGDAAAARALFDAALAKDPGRRDALIQRAATRTCGDAAARKEFFDAIRAVAAVDDPAAQDDLADADRPPGVAPPPTADERCA